MDPTDDFAPTKMLGGFYGTFDWTLPQGRVVKDYLAADVSEPVLAGVGDGGRAG